MIKNLFQKNQNKTVTFNKMIKLVYFFINIKIYKKHLNFLNKKIKQFF